MDIAPTVPPDVQASIRKRAYQRQMYIRRKAKNRALEEIRIKEKSIRVKQAILDAGGTLQSLPP